MSEPASGDQIRRYYDGRYARQREDAFPADMSRYRAWLRQALESGAAGEALDYGCGVGYVCSLLADHGYDVTGIDISEVALTLAREREPRVEFIKASGSGALPFPDDVFDLVTCLGVLEHVPEPGPVVAELHRVARPGTMAIWVVPNARSPYFWLGHGTGQEEEHPRSSDRWRELLAGAGWRIEHIERDPGPIDRPMARWKRFGQGVLNRLPLGLTYQFVIVTRA